jgi:hypothetical protein
MRDIRAKREPLSRAGKPLDRHDSSLARASNRPGATRKKRIPQTTFATHSSISYPQNTTRYSPFFPENTPIHHSKKILKKNKKRPAETAGLLC